MSNNSDSPHCKLKCVSPPNGRPPLPGPFSPAATRRPPSDPDISIVEDEYTDDSFDPPAPAPVASPAPIPRPATPEPPAAAPTPAPATAAITTAPTIEDDSVLDEHLELFDDELEPDDPVQRYALDPEKDLNRVTDYELALAKAKMDQAFQAHRLKPGDPGFEYDRQLEFSAPKEEASWDEDGSEGEEPPPRPPAPAAEPPRAAPAAAPGPGPSSGPSQGGAAFGARVVTGAGAGGDESEADAYRGDLEEDVFGSLDRQLDLDPYEETTGYDPYDDDVGDGDLDELDNWERDRDLDLELPGM